MNQISSILRKAALVAGLTGSLFFTAAHAAIGDRYVSATLDFLDLDDADLRNARGESFVFNTPLSQQFDLSTRYSYLYTRDRATRDKYAGHELFFDGTYAFGSDGPRPYVRTGLGWARATGAGSHTSDWLYDVELGVELSVGLPLKFTPYVNLTDGFRRRVDSAFEYGLRGEVKLAKAVSLLGGVSRNDDHEWGYKTGLLVQF